MHVLSKNFAFLTAHTNRRIDRTAERTCYFENRMAASMPNPLLVQHTSRNRPCCSRPAIGTTQRSSAASSASLLRSDFWSVTWPKSCCPLKVSTRNVSPLEFASR